MTIFSIASQTDNDQKQTRIIKCDENQRPYKMIRRIGRIIFYNGHTYQMKSYNKAKQKFATLAGKQGKRRLRYSWKS